MKYLGIEIDLSKDDLLTEQAKVYWSTIYCKTHETSPQMALARACTAFCFGDYELAQQLYNDCANLDAMGASPVITNSPEIVWPESLRDIKDKGLQFTTAAAWLKDEWLPNNKIEGLPISCFLMTLPDSRQGLVDASSEAKWLSMYGGGVGIHPLNRPVDGKSTGVMTHMKDYDNIARAYKQAETRRGSLAGFLDVDHPEILQFMDMRVPHGELSRRCLDLNNGVNITDKFMLAVKNDEDWPLVNKHTGHLVDTVKARELWENLLDLRYEKGQGEPYIVFIDRLNEALPQTQKDLGLKCHGSNICVEITLPTNEERTAVCCLSSINLENYDTWPEGIVSRWVRYLDNVIEYFVICTPEELKRAKFSAMRERAIGLGTMGYQSYFQKKGIPLESGGFNSAVQHSHLIYKKIKEDALAATKQLAIERGEAPDMVGTGQRNSRMLAIAPNASIASLVGTSAGIESYRANVFVHKTRAGSFLIKNKYLDEILQEHGDADWVEQQWQDIMQKDGSCQHLDYLTDEQKAVFKTAMEIDQMWIIELAATRQAHVCQSESLNLFFPPETTKQYFSDVHWKAWTSGVKTLYYARTDKKFKGKKLSAAIELVKLGRHEETNVVDDTELCLGCGG